MKYYLGIDVGGSKIAFGVADENKNLICKSAIKTDLPYEQMMEKMSKSALAFVAEQGISLDDLVSVGIGLPGVVDGVTNRLVMATNLGWFDKDVVADVQQYIQKPVYIANDADSATLGELLAGAGKEYRSLTMLTLGTGVGGGVIYDGKIFGGGDKGGLELGHLTLVAGGSTCSCTNQGCLEMYASTTALVRFARENAVEGSKLYELCQGDLSRMDGKIIFQAADEGDEAALQTLDTFRGYLASACYTVIMSFRTEALVIGGGISARQDMLVEPVREMVRKKLERFGNVANTPILAAKLGNDAGILGACFLADM